MWTEIEGTAVPTVWSRARVQKALQRTEGEAVATVEAMVATEANMLAAAASTMIVVVAVAGGAT